MIHIIITPYVFLMRLVDRFLLVIYNLQKVTQHDFNRLYIYMYVYMSLYPSCWVSFESLVICFSNNTSFVMIALQKHVQGAIKLGSMSKK